MIPPLYPPRDEIRPLPPTFVKLVVVALAVVLIPRVPPPVFSIGATKATVTGLRDDSDSLAVDPAPTFPEWVLGDIAPPRNGDTVWIRCKTTDGWLKLVRRPPLFLSRRVSSGFLEFEGAVKRC